MSTHDPLLAQGIAAARAGDKGTARRLLSQAVQRDPDLEAGWLWLSSVLDTPQGRAFCLRRALALNPANQASRRGLAALETLAPAPAVVAQPPPDPTVQPAPPPDLPATPLPDPVVQPASPDAPAELPSGLGGLFQREWFWRVVVSCLAVVALGLVVILAYAAFSGASAAEDGVIAAITPSSTPWPRGTLRATFTATPTRTPTATPTFTPAPTSTPTATPTPTPTPTETFTPVPTRRLSGASIKATSPPPASVPRPTLPPRSLDPRLAPLGIRVEPAGVGVGQPYWRLVEARWANEQQSAGKHSIYVEVLNRQGQRAVGQPVIVHWVDGDVVLPVENRPAPDWGVNFAMYNCLGSYDVSVGGAPSDRIVGLGMGTADSPRYTIHTSFYLTFRLVNR